MVSVISEFSRIGQSQAWGLVRCPFRVSFRNCHRCWGCTCHVDGGWLGIAAGEAHALLRSATFVCRLNYVLYLSCKALLCMVSLAHTPFYLVVVTLVLALAVPSREQEGYGSKWYNRAASDAYSTDGSPNYRAVLAAVAVACMGAFAFGYHLGVVNGPLEAIAKDLGFAGNKALQGLVRHMAT